MHIGIGAAILILGLLWLATSKAGLKVLGVLAVLAVVGVGGLLYLGQQNDLATHQACAAKVAHAAEITAHGGYAPLLEPECRPQK